MTKEIEYTTTKTLKAKITASKPHFLQKVISHRAVVEDAFKAHFRSDITIFVPKMKPEHVEPRIMMHVKNGNGSCLIRMKSPEELASVLRQLADIITSDIWLDKWQELCDLSSRIIDGDIILDSDFIDVDDFQRYLKVQS